MKISKIIYLQIHIVLIAFNFQIVLAQENPNFDNTWSLIPPKIINVLQGREAITSEDGFDNFFLGQDFAEPHISANPSVPFEYFNAFNTNSTHYTYDGNEWFFQVPNFGFTMRGDPVTAYDSLGNLYYENMYGSGNILGCKVIRSTDNGATWSAAVTSIAGVDKNWIACDQTSGPFANYVYTTMTAGNGFGRFARSTNFGATWQTTFTPNTQSLPGMMVAVGPDVLGTDVPGGAVYVVTNSGNAFAAVYRFYVSHDGGATFTLKSAQQFPNYVGSNVNGRHSVENMRTRPYPFITADNSYGPHRGRLYVVYASNNPPGNGNKPDIYCRYSDDQGATWSSAITVNDDPNSQNNHQWIPATWCDKETGRLYIKWFDTRNVPTSDSAEVYASYSDDGGVTWAENQNLSTSKFKIDCNTCGGGGTPRYQGDYDAITSNSVTSMAVWSDFRNGSFGSYVAYFPDFAMTISANADTLKPVDSLEISIKIPAVKLYNNTVKFSATVSPQANFVFSFPEGDSLNAYPDSVILKINSDNVPPDNYVITVQGAGPNGTPVHRRTIDLLVTNPTISVVQPNGGEELFIGTLYPIKWDKIFVDSVTLHYSIDGGISWLPVEGVNPNYNIGNNPKVDNHSMQKGVNGITSSQFGWVVPNVLSDNCLIRVSDNNDSTLFDISDTTFSIVAGPLPNWRAQVSGIDSSMISVSVVDTTFAWAGTTTGAILRTTNGGSNWTVVNSSQNGKISSIAAVDELKSFIVVNSPSGTKIRRTLIGGISWSTVYEDTTTGAYINAIKMFDEDNGFAVGDPLNGQWKLLKTTNGGTDWFDAATLPQDGSEKGWNNSMSWIGNQFGWFGTNNGHVYRTTDGGASWTASATTFTNSIAVSFVDEMNGLASGDGTNRSIDGGANWSASQDQLPGTVFGSDAVSLDQGRWYLITGGEIYKTVDQGDNFQLEFLQTDVYQAIDMKIVKIGENDWLCGYAVGDNGTITKYLELYTVTDVVANSDLVPDRFKLMQNYPNPFNPTTIIKFTISSDVKRQMSNVKLIVYDVLGNEVATLVNEEKPAGSYEVEFDASKLSSGIYFYRLSAGSFIETKKMVLLR